MKLLGIFELLLTIYLASAISLRGRKNYTLKQQLFTPVPQQKEPGFHSRITNGSPARPKQFPYQVGLATSYNDRPNDLLCGGSIISMEWVLTAAHCLIDGIHVSVYIGSVILDEHQTPYHRAPKRDMIEHRNYFSLTHENDIGLVKVPPIRFREGIGAVDLPPADFPLHIDLYAYHAGWGITSDELKMTSPHLLYHKFKIISNEECEKVFGSMKISWGKMCVGTSDKKSGCEGDSGGPLVLEGTNIQIGINSFGWGLGCELGYPTAFTRVQDYLEWIHLKTGISV